MPRICYKTTTFQLSDHLLFISIRQIFDHISAHENKVSEATFSEISPIQEISMHPKNVLKYMENEVCPKGLEYATKLQHFTFLTVYFSSQSDKYSIIYLPLKIKFLRQHFQKFLEFKKFSCTQN